MIQSIFSQDCKTWLLSIYLPFPFWENLVSVQIPWLQYFPIPNGQQDDIDTETS